MITQKQQVLWHLQNIGSLTQYEATMYYGITRLGARIYELRQEGWPIKSSQKRVKSRYGNGHAHVAEYTLNSEGDET